MSALNVLHECIRKHPWKTKKLFPHSGILSILGWRSLLFSPLIIRLIGLFGGHSSHNSQPGV